LRGIQDPQFSPDGTRVAFVVTDPLMGQKRTRHIWIYDLKSKATRQFTYSEKSETSPRWSPDGKQLAFLSGRGGDQQQIFVMRVDGGEAAALTRVKRASARLNGRRTDRRSRSWRQMQNRKNWKEGKRKRRFARGR